MWGFDCEAIGRVIVFLVKISGPLSRCFLHTGLVKPPQPLLWPCIRPVIAPASNSSRFRRNFYPSHYCKYYSLLCQTTVTEGHSCASMSPRNPIHREHKRQPNLRASWLYSKFAVGLRAVNPTLYRLYYKRNVEIENERPPIN